MVTPIRLYLLHCTLYCCTLTRRQSSVLVALSPAFVSDFCFKFCSVHSIGYNFHSTFHLRFRLEINSFFFPIQFSVGSKQRATTTLDFEHVFRCSHFSRCSFAQFNPVRSCIFCVCHIFVSSPNLLPYSGFHFLFLVGRVPSKPFCQLSLIRKT